MDLPNEIYFDIEGIDASLANAIRRVIIGRIPSIVIDTACVKENDSFLCDEFIVHRLGQIPLRKKPDEVITDFKIKLEEIGPKRVYSRDIQFPPGIEPVSNDIILLDLGPEELIKITGNIEEGSPKEHSKYSVSCGTSYKKIVDKEVVKFRFHVETTGSLTAKQAWNEALKIIKDELLQYKKFL